MSRNIAIFLKELYYQLFIMHPDFYINIKIYFLKLCIFHGYLCTAFKLIAFIWQERKVPDVLHLFFLKVIIVRKM